VSTLIQLYPTTKDKICTAHWHYSDEIYEIVKRQR